MIYIKHIKSKNTETQIMLIN